LGETATADEYATAALVAFGRVLDGDLFDVSPKSATEGVNKEVRAAWEDVFRYSKIALEKRGKSALANRVLGEALYLVSTYDRLRWIHFGTIKDNPNGPVGNYQADGEQLWKKIEDHLAVATDSPGRVESSALFARADNLFTMVAHKSILGLPKGVARQELETVGVLCERAIKQGYREAYRVHQLRGLELEDRAWMTAAAAGDEFRSAEYELKAAVREVNPETEPGDRISLFHPFYLLDLGRCQYRAATFGKPNAVPVSEAIATLRDVPLAFDKNKMVNLAMPDRAARFGAEAGYWLGMALWSAERFDEASQAFLTAETKASKFPDDNKAKVWKALAIYDRGRMAAERSRKVGPGPERVRLGAETTQAADDLKKFLDENKGVDFKGFIDREALLRSMASAVNGQPIDAADAMDRLAAKIEHDYSVSTVEQKVPLLAYRVYIDTLFCSVELWAEKGLSVKNADRAARIAALQKSMTDYPWLLTRAEKERVRNAIPPTNK
jgi:hypothetical protein